MLTVSDQDIWDKMMDVYKKNVPEYIITYSIGKAIFLKFKDYLIDLHDNPEKVNNLDKMISEYLLDEKFLNFIKEKQPNTAPVPDDVVSSISDWFKNNLSSYNPLEIYRQSNHLEDDYLYMIIAKKGNDEYACWTCWNQTTGSLNFGHYGYSTKEVCKFTLKSYFNDITGEPDKYGMDSCKYYFNKDDEYAALEAKHFGDPVKKTGIYSDPPADQANIIYMHNHRKAGR